MLGTVRFQLRTAPLIKPKCDRKFNYERHRVNIRLNNRPIMCLSLQQSQLSDSSSHLISTVGSSSSSFPAIHPSQWTLTHRHIHILNFIACATAISATWLFCSVIPTLLAFKRAAESFEKLMNVTMEELPDTMAAVRLSGMEITDLTTELSDLGQGITQGVKNSTRAVRMAEERLRRLTNMTPSEPLQELVPVEVKAAGPVLARTARNIRLGIVKGRAVLQMFFTVTQFSRIVFNFFKTRAKA